MYIKHTQHRYYRGSRCENLKNDQKYFNKWEFTEEHSDFNQRSYGLFSLLYIGNNPNPNPNHNPNPNSNPNHNINPNPDPNLNPNRNSKLNPNPNLNPNPKPNP